MLHYLGIDNIRPYASLCIQLLKESTKHRQVGNFITGAGLFAICGFPSDAVQTAPHETECLQERVLLIWMIPRASDSYLSVNLNGGPHCLRLEEIPCFLHLER